jgi:hypothetical protein
MRAGTTRLVQDIRDCVAYLRAARDPWEPEASYWQYVDAWWLRTPARRGALWRMMDAAARNAPLDRRALSMLRRRLRDV